MRQKKIRCFSILLLIGVLTSGILPVSAAPQAYGQTEVPPVQEMPVPDAMYYVEMPWYDQNDYPGVPYGGGTVANNGSGVTALAMVASYMTGYEYTPDMLAEYFGGEAENNIVRLETGSRKLKLSWRRARNWNAVLAALKEGKVAIVLIDGPCELTQTQHFVVLKGVTNAGLVLVNDPDGQNYGKPELATKLTYGMETKDIWQHYGGGWIYDKDKMPATPFYYQETETRRGQPRYPDMMLSEGDIDLIARLVWAEARGESDRGQQAVAEVVLNRLNSPNFPNDLYALIYGEGQFRTSGQLSEATPSQSQYKAVERAIYGPYVLPKEVVYFGRDMTGYILWGKIGHHSFCYEHNYLN